MSHSVHVKANHKAIQTYYQSLKDYHEHGVGHETALRSAFQNLLADIAKSRHWLLIPEQSNRSGGKRVVPDGTLCDDLNLHRGYWEAKDTDDDLDAEIAKKTKKGYPLKVKLRLSKDKSALTVNPSLTLAGIPLETLAYRLGNRSALEWVIDQYQVREDKRSGIRSEPNRAGDPEYIVRLVGQVMRVSLETVRIVASLPES